MTTSSLTTRIKAAYPALGPPRRLEAFETYTAEDEGDGRLEDVR
jgi:hypothetical protein